MIFDDFFWRAILAGLGVVVVAGPLGCFIVWRRMAYFGDTMAHAGLLGVALGFLIGYEPTLGVVVVTVTVALLLLTLQQGRWLSSDTLLGILSHSTLSLGLIALAAMTWLRVDLLGYLFGDILSVGLADLVWIYGGGAVVLALLAVIWRPLLAITLHEELARAEGVAALPVRLVFTLLIALVIGIAIKVVGVLLITSLLIIPAATARRFATTPEQMALLAAVAGAIAVGLGLFASLRFDSPSGPSIVLAAASLFLLAVLASVGRPRFPIGRRVD